MSKYRKTVFGEDKTVGHGWVAIWADGTLGHILPSSLGHGNNMPDWEPWMGANTELVLCKITVEVERRSDGRLIAKTLKAET